MRSIVWMSQPLSRALRAQLPSEPIVVGSAKELLDTPRDSKVVVYLDANAIAALDDEARARGLVLAVEEIVPPGPVVAICEDQLQTSIGWLPTHPWLSHVVSASMLEHPMFKDHLANVVATATSEGQPKLLDWLGKVTGRRIRLAQASKRFERLDRMCEYFEKKGVGARTVEQLRDAAEELLTNAFYDAPVAAGALERPISRTQDISLPDDSACDMVYGCRDDLAVVRVRDPFGSLSRSRLVEVLTRCARTDMQVEVDETMGGAGLGLWRIFTAASFVALSVVNNKHTEFLVGISIGKRVAGPKPFAFHLFFRDGVRPVRRWRLFRQDSSHPSVDHSVTILTK